MTGPAMTRTQAHRVAQFNAPKGVVWIAGWPRQSPAWWLPVLAILAGCALLVVGR